MKRNVLYHVYLLFCLVMALSGCGRGDVDISEISGSSTITNGGQEKTESAEAYIPVAEYTMLSIPEEAQGSGRRIGFYQDGEIYYIHDEYMSDGPGESHLIVTAADGTGPSRVLAKSDRGTYIGDFFIDRKNNLYLYEYKLEFGNNIYEIKSDTYLRKVSADGQELYRTDLGGIVGGAYPNYVACYVNRDGNAILLDAMEDQVFFVNSEGEYYGRAETASDAIHSHLNTNEIVYIENQGYYLWYADVSADCIKLWEVDFQNGLVAEKPIIIYIASMVKKTESGESVSSNNYMLFDGGELGLLISTENVLWRYDFAAKEMIEIFRWDDENIDLDGRMISQIKWGAAGEEEADRELFVWQINNFVIYSNPMLVSIRYVDRKQVPKRQTVAIGLDRYYGDIKNLVRRFNRLNGTYRAKLVKYDSGALKEMLMYGSAELPDLLEITGIRTEWLETKGLLEDLNPYFERSSIVSREDILPSVLELLEENGKLLSMATSFSMRCMITAADIMEEKHSMEGEYWDYDRFLELGEQYPESWYYDRHDAASVWGGISITALGEFIDWKEGKCSFDSEEFKGLIEKINSLDYSVKRTGEERIDLEKLISQQVLFQYADYGSPWDYNKKMHDANGKIKSVGFPSMDGEPVFLFQASQNLAIYAESPNKEGAWAFLEFLLSEDEQSWYSSANDAFPVRREAFESYLTKVYSIKREIYSTEDVEAGTPGRLRYMAEHLGMNQNDGEISVIVMEELRPYFAGHKTVDEVVKVIQNRVQLYLDEM